MLTIKNILKLQNQPIWDGWEVKLIYEGNHNDTYIFELHRESAWGNGDCTIMYMVYMNIQPIIKYTYEVVIKQ